MVAVHVVKIPKALVVAAANAYASGIEVRIDTWGAWNGRDWYTDNSYVLLPSGARRPLDIPRTRQWVTPARRWRAYADEIVSQIIAVKLDGEWLRLSVLFESTGHEVRLGCINRLDDKPCDVHLLKHTGQVNNAQVHARFEPTVTGGKIAFRVTREVEVDFDLSFDSWVLQGLKPLVRWFKDNDKAVKQLLAAQIKGALQSEDVSRGLAVDLNKAVLDRVVNFLRRTAGPEAAGYLKEHVRVVGIDQAGSDFKVSVSYPAPVTAGSLDITSFEVEGADRTINCPGEVSFRATIHTDHAMTGKAWLENEDGSVTGKLNWSNGADRTTTSTISRPWSKPDQRSHEGWSRLVVTFSDVTGKAVTKKSGKAAFRRTCRGSITTGR